MLKIVTLGVDVYKQVNVCLIVAYCVCTSLLFFFVSKKKFSHARERMKEQMANEISKKICNKKRKIKLKLLKKYKLI